MLSEGAQVTLVSAVLFGAALACVYSTRRLRRLRMPLGVVAVVGAVIGGYLFWYGHRPLPDAGRWTLFDGIDYVRDVRSSPRPMVIHVVEIDLHTPGLRFLSTPGDDGADGDFAARTVSKFREEFGLQLAINGDFFDPWRDYGFYDYYPHEGDPVNARGVAISSGDLVTAGYAKSDGFDTLYVTGDNRASFDAPDGALNAISGNIMLLVDGVPLDLDASNAYIRDPNPRTAIGLDEAGRTLLFILVDGRQPNYSEGATIADLVAIAQQYGAHDALNLDGGGSTALVVEGEDGRSVVLNSPIHNRIPGRERPIANHLGVYAAHGAR